MENEEKQKEITSLDASLEKLQCDDEAEEILDSLPERERKTIERYMIRQSYSGPLPPPHLLKQFDDVEPGTAKTIIDNFVAESEHRRNLENKSLDYSARDVKMGAWFGFILGLVGLLGGFLILLLTDHVLAGSILSGGSVVALVALFMYPNKSKKSTMNNEKIDNEDEVD